MTIDNNNCFWCAEPVGADEQHPSFQQPAHLECGFRAVAGGINHLKHKCGCFIAENIGDDPVCTPDDPNLTKRKAAQAALDYWIETNPPGNYGRRMI